MKKKISVLVCLLAVFALLTGCTQEKDSFDDSYNDTTPSIPQTSTIQTITMPPAAVEKTTTQTNKTSILRENTLPGDGGFAKIIKAYAELEKSGYKSFDKALIGDSVFTENDGSTYNFGDNPAIMYAYYDINKDGTPELLIGAEESISGIYILKNGNPVSLIQVEARSNINLLKDSTGNCVIEDATGHMGYATECFYTISKDGKLVTLDILHTNGDNKKDDELIGHFRTKDVLGKEVSITEEEYCSIIRKYGSTGYEPFEDMGKGRNIDLVWKPVVS